MESTQPEPGRYLVWDTEFGWRIEGVADIAKDIEHSHYSGYGSPEKFFLLDDDKGDVTPVTVTFLDSCEDDNSYGHSRYHIGTGESFEEFTVRIDLRN